MSTEEFNSRNFFAATFFKGCSLSAVFIIFFFSFTFSAFSQKVDSLYNALKNEKEDTNKVHTLNRLSRALYIISDYAKADSVARKALLLANNLNFKRGAADANIGIGAIYYRQGNYADALKFQLQGLKTAEEAGYKKGMAGSYTSIGNIYDDQGNHDEALDYYMKSLKIYKEMNDKRSMGVDYGNIGLVYMSENKYGKALEFQQEALRIDQELNDVRGMGFDYGNIGITYEAKGNYKDALTNYLQNLRIAETLDDKESMSYAYEKVSSIAIRQKKYALAKQYLDSCLLVAKEISEKIIVKEAYSDLNHLDSLMGNYKTAFEDYKMYIVYCDSLKNEENTKKLVSEQMQYEFDKKQAEQKAIQDKKDADEAAAGKRQEIITVSVSTGLFLVLVFSGLLFSRFKVTQKQKRIIEEQKALVEEKNKEVLDSITYAKRLQDAILPPISIIQKYLPESFVLYKPKDIVAGDFYWIAPLPPEGGISGETKNPPLEGREALLIAAADCTGHGVPGAMVSVVCSNALNRTVKEFKITEPGKVLDRVRELVLETFSQRDPFGEKSENNVQDGMDISLVAISQSPLVISWSGAYNPLWYIQNNEIKEVTPDKQPIGKTDNPKPFNTNKLSLNKGDILYLFTDGYADQFGGPKGKKFKYKQLQEKLLAISHQPMEKQKQELETVLEQWKGNLEQVDDVLIIGIRV
jgi:tetratricopeptide (TPR) repeat protein